MSIRRRSDVMYLIVLFLIVLFLIFQVFLDKACRRAVLGLVIKCDNAKRKCDWTGELSATEVKNV